jgi:hypothetical protein
MIIFLMLLTMGLSSLRVGLLPYIIHKGRIGKTPRLEKKEENL